jgi:hypothetical protein
MGWAAPAEASPRVEHDASDRARPGPLVAERAMKVLSSRDLDWPS